MELKRCTQTRHWKVNWASQLDAFNLMGFHTAQIMQTSPGRVSHPWWPHKKMRMKNSFWRQKSAPAVSLVPRHFAPFVPLKGGAACVWSFAHKFPKECCGVERALLFPHTAPSACICEWLSLSASVVLRLGVCVFAAADGEQLLAFSAVWENSPRETAATAARGH